jgi:hypothetical protein
MKITKFFFSLITCLTFLGCEENPQIQPSKERLKDIHEVIKAIIIQDSIFENIFLRNPTWFCIDLKKVNLYPSPQYDSGELRVPPTFGDHYYEELLQFPSLKDETFFKPEDTIEFIIQNKYPNYIRLDTNLVEVSNPIIYDSTLTMHKKGHHLLYDFNIPIFSKNGQRVCVYSGYYCGGLCGRGKVSASL